MNLMTMFAGTPAKEPRRTNRLPEGLAEPLQTQFGLSAKASGADIGAGSGRLTAHLLERNYAVTAVDSRVDKRRDCALLKSRWPKLNVIAGSAASTGLPDASMDFLASSRALYAPDRDAVRREFQRILKPGGLVLLITDNRVYTGGEQSEAFENFLRTHCPHFREKTTPLDIGESVQAFYGAPVYEDAFVSHDCYTLEQFLTQTRRLAIYPEPSDPHYDAIEAALPVFFKRWAIADELIVPKICRAAYGPLND